MNDLLELIAIREEAITRRWSRALRDLPDSPYVRMAEDELAQSVRRSCQALLRVMQTGDTAALEVTLQDSARRRAEAGFRYEDNVAAWLLYRQVLQEVLRDEMHTPEDWEQFVDRIDAILDWVARLVHAVYRPSDPVD